MPVEVLTDHELLYETDAPITAKSLADALLGLDGVVSKSAAIIARILPEVAGIDAHVLITRIERGSYKENFLIRLVFGKGETAEKNIEKLRKKLGLEKMEIKTLITLTICAAILYGASDYVISKLTASPDASAAAVHIENSFNAIGAELNLSPTEIRAILDAALQKDKEALKKQVVKLAHPGGDAKGGKITIDGNEALSITKEIIQQIPADYVKADAEEPFRDFTKVQMVMRAADLDRPSTGWAGIVPEITERRLPVELSPEIEIGKVPIGRYFNADLTLLYRLDKAGNKHAKRFLVRKIYPPERPVSTTSDTHPTLFPLLPP